MPSCDCGCEEEISLEDWHISGKKYINEAHKKRAWRRTHETHPERLPTSKNVIALDGEGIQGKYVLLATSRGDYIEDYKGGLSTWRCFQFLLTLEPNALKWGFGFGYDVNMILRDLAPDKLRNLRVHNWTSWDKYYVHHIPGKKFFVKDRDTGRSIAIWDQLPFVQCSFVKFLKQFELASPEEIERISLMKDQRSDFSQVDPEEIRRYCISECVYLEKGVSHFLELYEGMGYKPSNYYSPGTLAALEMGKRRVKDYYERPNDEISELVSRGYYGGRSEASTVGPIHGPFSQYDINSAYPFAATMLPCFSHGKWRRHRANNEISPLGIYKLRFKLLDGKLWGAFPWRPKSGSLKFPQSGETTVWGVELLCGTAFLADYEILQGWVFEPGCTHTPFRYLGELYSQRQELKANGDPREYVVKLILNSTYGKLAQRKGWKGQTPTYQSIEWAGLITAFTRATLLSVLAEQGESIVLVATDSLLSSKELDLSVGKGLGLWEKKTLTDIFIVGAGFYFASSEGEELISRTRGVKSGSVDFREIQKSWETAGRDGTYTVAFNRFIGYSLALQRREGYRFWRHFIHTTLTKRFSLLPRREWLSPDDRMDGRSIPPTLATVKKGELLDQFTDQTSLAMLDYFGETGSKDFLKALVSIDSKTFAKRAGDQPDWIIQAMSQQEGR